MAELEEKREHWSGALGFVLAAVGSAVGLGNVWKFPYITGEYGGGAFVIVYLVCIALVGLPILVAEMMAGRRSQKGPVGAFAALAPKQRGGMLWAGFGFFAILTGFVLLSFYSVVGGWSIAYAWKAVSGSLTAGDPEAIKATFGNYISDPWRAAGTHALFMSVTIAIVYGGISNGIERAARTLMPAFGGLLVILLGYSISTGGMGDAFAFMFYPDFGRIMESPDAILEALGHSFFTLSLGMGAIIVYGSYLGEGDSLFKSSLAIAVLDTLVALTAGLVIFGIVFSQGEDPAAGPGLVFEMLPVLFAEMPGGSLWATLFFVLLTFAALTSAMSLLEVVVSYFVDELEWERHHAAVVFGILIFLAGIPSVLSFSTWDWMVFPVGGKEMSLFDFLNHLVSGWALPLGGLGIGLYVGWAVPKEEWYDEIEGDGLGMLMFKWWLWLTRILAPLAVIVILGNMIYGTYLTGG
jgi:NSS family neurotransmitter:Na+ symporter